MIETFEIHSGEIADSFLSSLVAGGANYREAQAHAADKISDPIVRSHFLERAGKVLER